MTSRESQAQCAVFVAFGTRGDVQPAACLALALRKRLGSGSPRIKLLTHAEHAGWLEPLLRSAGVELVHSPSYPASVWEDELGGSGKRPRTMTGDITTDARRVLRRVQHLEVCVAACSDAAIIAFNLFSLELWHVAEYYRVPSIAISPYQIPNGAPHDFERRFAAELPDLYTALREAPDDGSVVGWKEMDLWMWRLFLEDYGKWRSKRLKLPAVPFVQRGAQGVGSRIALPAPTPLIFGFSPVIYPAPSYWPLSVTATGFWFLGDDVQSTPEMSLQKWVEANEADNCPIVYLGFGAVAKMGLIADPEHVLRTVAAAVRRQCLDVRVRVLLVTEGASRLNACWRKLSKPGRLSTTDLDLVGGVPWPETADRLRSADAPASDNVVDGALDLLEIAVPGSVCEHIALCSAAVPHDWLLPRCSACIHHGGSGTVAACLRHGVPQVLVPFIFDQFGWADRLEWLGLAQQPLRAKELDGTEVMRRRAKDGMYGRTAGHALAEALEQCLLLNDGDMGEIDGVMRRKCAEVAHAISTERGTAVAVDAILLAWSSVVGDAHSCRPVRSSVGFDRPTGFGSCFFDAKGRVVLPNGFSLEVPSPPASSFDFVNVMTHVLREVEHIYAELYGFAQHDDVGSCCYLGRGGVALPPAPPPGFLTIDGHEQQRSCKRLLVDVGANVGLWVLRMADWLRKNGMGNWASDTRVIAVEPARATFHALLRNLGGDEVIDYEKDRVEMTSLVFDSVVCHRAALSNAAVGSTADLTFYPKMPGNSTLRPTEKEQSQLRVSGAEWFEGAATESCPLFSLSTLLRQEVARTDGTPAAQCAPAAALSVELLKIDCEGAELDVLRGIEDEHWLCIRQVVIEVHDLPEREGGEEKGRCELACQLLESKGFTISTERDRSLEKLRLCNVLVFAVKA